MSFRKRLLLIAGLLTVLIGWATFAHTGILVPTSALGVGADLFNGYHDQTAINSRTMQVTGLKR